MTYDEKTAWLTNCFRLTGSINLAELTSAILNILVNLNGGIYNKNGEITNMSGLIKQIWIHLLVSIMLKEQRD